MYSNKQIADIFRRTKKYLQKNIDETGPKSEYICFALNRVVGSVLLKEECKNIIQKRLGRHANFSIWLKSNCPEYKQLTKKNSRLAFNRCQEHRHAWLDSLIKEYDEKD